MSEIILSDESGIDWTENELHALNITIDTLDSTSFSGAALSAAVAPILLDNRTCPSGQRSKENQLFFRCLEDDTSGFLSGPYTESAAITDFAAFLLQMLDYDEPDGIVKNTYRSVSRCAGRMSTSSLRWW
jgi:hypothetical protein